MNLLNIHILVIYLLNYKKSFKLSARKVSSLKHLYSLACNLLSMSDSRQIRRFIFTHTHTHTHIVNSLMKYLIRNTHPSKVWVCVFLLKTHFCMEIRKQIALPRTHPNHACFDVVVGNCFIVRPRCSTVCFMVQCLSDIMLWVQNASVLENRKCRRPSVGE